MPKPLKAVAGLLLAALATSGCVHTGPNPPTAATPPTTRTAPATTTPATGFPFLIGREYWSLQNGERFRAIYDRFLQDPASPWNANPWNMNLQVATPLPIAAN